MPTTSARVRHARLGGSALLRKDRQPAHTASCMPPAPTRLSTPPAPSGPHSHQRPALAPAGRTVLEVLTDFKSAAVPLEWLLQTVPRLKPRLFSIASGPLLHPASVHLTVAVVEWATPYKRRRRGVCTSWLAGGWGEGGLGGVGSANARRSPAGVCMLGCSRAAPAALNCMQCLLPLAPCPQAWTLPRARCCCQCGWSGGRCACRPPPPRHSSWWGPAPEWPPSAPSCSSARRC